MKIALSLIISLLMIIGLLSSCADTNQTKKTVVETKNPVVQSGGGDYAVEAINRQIKDFSIDGFSGGSSAIKKNQDLENMKKIVGIVKPIVDQIPDGYVMQITGHTSGYDSKSMQMRVSKARAEKVYSELKKAGVSAGKMTYKGVGANEPLDGVDIKDNQQRRVSFKAVKK